MSQRKASKRKSRQDTSLLQNKTVQSIGLILLTLFLAVSLFETQSSSSLTLRGLGSLGGTFLNYLFGFAACLLIAWLSALTYFRLRSKQSPLTSKLPSSLLLLAGAGILDSSGGLIGESLSMLLESAIGTWGSKLLLLSISALCLIKLKGYSNQRITDFFKRAGINRKQRDEGSTSGRVVSLLKSNDNLYIARNHWPKRWYDQALANPEISVESAGTTNNYLAVPVTGNEYNRVNSDNPLPTFFRFLTGFPPRYFIRLDPT